MNLSEPFLHASVVRGLRQNWRLRKYSYSHRSRPDNGFLLLLKGTMEYVTERETTVLKEGGLIFLPAGSKYEVRIHTEKSIVEDLLINFELPSRAPSLPKTPTVILDRCPDAVAAVMERTVREYEEDLPFLVQSDFYRLCHQILPLKNGTDKDNEIIQTAKRLLSGEECLPLNEIAARLLICPSGLRKKFKDATGISPTEFRIRKRIERAETFLRSTDLSVEEIAARCNFYDTAYFCKTFKKHTGTTPKEYRESGDLYL